MARGKIVMFILYFWGINSNPQAVNLSRSLFPNTGEWKGHYKDQQLI
jgi:hypothetical protein